MMTICKWRWVRGKEDWVIYFRWLGVFILACLVFHAISTSNLLWSSRDVATNCVSSRHVQKQSPEYKRKAKFVEDDPQIRALEQYIFQNKNWIRPTNRTDPENDILLRYARINNKSDLDLIPVVDTDKRIDCQKLIMNDPEFIRIGKEYMKAHPKLMDTMNLEKLISGRCDEFIQERRYITSSMTTDEENFPIAYGILVYKDIEMVERLLRAIYRPQNYYCFHVDAKSEELFYTGMLALTNCFENVFIASRRIDVRWGTVTLFLSDLLCMRDMVQYSWKYYINLAGQEFPIRNNYELVQVLRTFNGVNDLQSNPKHHKGDRYESIHGLNGHRTGFPLPEVPLNITVVKGNMHGAFSRGFIDFLLHDQKSKMFFDWVKQTGMPEETYYATVNSNPHLGAPGSNKGTNLLARHSLISREIRWHKGCGGKLVRGVCVCGIADLKRLTRSKKLFLNKFHLDYEYLAFDCFEQWFYDQSRLTYSGEQAFDVEPYYKIMRNREKSDRQRRRSVLRPRVKETDK